MPVPRLPGAFLSPSLFALHTTVEMRHTLLNILNIELSAEYGERHSGVLELLVVQ
jgi:hypothetical protein